MLGKTCYFGKKSWDQQICKSVEELYFWSLLFFSILLLNFRFEKRTKSRTKKRTKSSYGNFLFFHCMLSSFLISILSWINLKNFDIFLVLSENWFSQVWTGKRKPVYFFNLLLDITLILTLREKCPNTLRTYFWSVFSCIRIEYEDLRSKSLYSIWIQENTDQK